VGLTTPHSKKLIVTKVEQRKSWIDLTMMERVGDREGKMEGSCSTGQSPQWAVVPVEVGEVHNLLYYYYYYYHHHHLVSKHNWMSSTKIILNEIYVKFSEGKRRIIS
jgi:hypothetical protein